MNSIRKDSFAIFAAALALSCGLSACSKPADQSPAASNAARPGVSSAATARDIAIFNAPDWNDEIGLWVEGHPDDGDAPLKVLLTAEAVYGDDEDMQGAKYLWDFGDGSPPSTEERPVHWYRKRGAYTVTAKVVDGKGRKGIDDTDESRCSRRGRRSRSPRMTLCARTSRVSADGLPGTGNRAGRGFPAAHGVFERGHAAGCCQ